MRDSPYLNDDFDQIDNPFLSSNFSKEVFLSLNHLYINFIIDEFVYYDKVSLHRLFHIFCALRNKVKARQIQYPRHHPLRVISRQGLQDAISFDSGWGSMVTYSIQKYINI